MCPVPGNAPLASIFFIWFIYHIPFDVRRKEKGLFNITTNEDPYPYIIRTKSERQKPTLWRHNIPNHNTGTLPNTNLQTGKIHYFDQMTNCFVWFESAFCIYNNKGEFHTCSFYESCIQHTCVSCFLSHFSCLAESVKVVLQPENETSWKYEQYLKTMFAWFSLQQKKTHHVIIQDSLWGFFNPTVEWTILQLRPWYNRHKLHNVQYWHPFEIDIVCQH